MLGPYKNKAIEDSFRALEEVQTKDNLCIVVGWLVKNAHDLTQEQLDYLDKLLCRPWKKKRGAPEKNNRKWELVRHFRKKYYEEGYIPTQAEVIREIVRIETNVTNQSAYRTIFNNIKRFILYRRGMSGRPKKQKKIM